MAFGVYRCCMGNLDCLLLPTCVLTYGNDQNGYEVFWCRKKKSFLEVIDRSKVTPRYLGVSLKGIDNFSTVIFISC